MAAHSSGTMNGSMTRKPSRTRPVSTTSVMRYRSHGEETKSSIMRMRRSAQARPFGGEHDEREQHAAGEGEIAPQRQPVGRQRRAQDAVLVQPETAVPDHEQRQAALAAEDRRHGSTQRRS